MLIKVMVAFSNTLFAEGVKRLLEGSEDIRVTEILKPGAAAYKAAEAARPDIILVDFTTLYNVFGEAGPNGMRFILFDTLCGEDNIISAVITRGLKGVLMGNSTAPLLKKAIRAVAEGEIWLDKLNVKNLLTGLHALKKSAKAALSEREWEVVSLVGRGYRNREIAEKLCISEPTVKTHLQRIFHKLDIQNRPQLITFAIKNQSELHQRGPVLQ
ncbi:MAG: response regulator transcription factor [Deltaproteobacteria bacterium]|nr:response regulator transcription factor [Deltaproteobacteria bacterium]